MDSWHPDYRRMWRDAERRRRRLRGQPLWQRAFEEVRDWSVNNAVLISAWMVCGALVWAVLASID